MQEITVLILAGGQSTRFWPLTNKMATRFLDKSFLEHQIQLISQAGFKNLIVVATTSLNRILDKKIQVVIQTGEGQGAAILSAANFITGKPVLIVNADDIVSVELLKQIFTVANSHHHLLVGRKSQHYFPGGYLVLEGNRVAKVVEKPGEGNEPSSFVKLVCDYYTNADTLLNYLKKEKEYDPKTHYEDALSSMMANGEHFEMLEYSNFWLPLKYPWQVLLLMDYYLKSTGKNISRSAKVHKTAILEGPIVLEAGVRILEYAKLVGPLYIGNNTIIGNHTLIRDSMVGSNCVIGFNSDVTRSYISDNCWFHSNYVGDSVIGNDVAMGAGAVLANLRLDEGNISSLISGEKISTHRNKLGAVIGRGSRIGVEAQLMPGIKVGKNSLVGPGVILDEDLSDNKKCILKQKLQVSDYIFAAIPNRDQFADRIK